MSENFQKDWKTFLQGSNSSSMKRLVRVGDLVGWKKRLISAEKLGKLGIPDPQCPAETWLKLQAGFGLNLRFG